MKIVKRVSIVLAVFLFCLAVSAQYYIDVQHVDAINDLEVRVYTLQQQNQALASELYAQENKQRIQNSIIQKLIKEDKAFAELFHFIIGMEGLDNEQTVPAPSNNGDQQDNYKTPTNPNNKI